MREYNRRQNYRQFLTRVYTEIIGLMILMLIMILAVHASWDMYSKFATAAGSRESVEAQLAVLVAQRTQVGAVVAQLGTPRGVEAAVRERYGVALPGEGAIQIVRQDATTTSQATLQPNVFSRIWHALFVW